MINYFKDLFFKINTFIYVIKTRYFEWEKTINDLKMREVEITQLKKLKDDLLIKLEPHPEAYKPFENDLDDGLIINPIWQLGVYDSDRKLLTGLPLLYWVHSHLKTYGFDPDNKLRSSDVKVRISMDVGKYVQFPLYIKGKDIESIKGERLSNVPPNIGEIDRGN